MIVADTQLLVYLYVRTEHTEQAEAVFTRDPAWAAPLLWKSEFRNALIGLVRRRVLALDQAVGVARDAESLMVGREYAVVTHQVLALAARSGCTAYDCEFIALAEDLGVPLVTADEQVLAAFPAAAVGPRAFAGAAGS